MINTITNFLKNNTFYYLLLIIIGAWHLWSLIYSPLPWFDETFFVSITKALLNGHGFMLEVCPIQTEGKEVLTYGPVYFSFTGLSFLIFGTGIFQFRIVALFFAALSIAVFSRMASRLKMGIVVTRILSLLLIFDVITVQSSHSGRMDMVALFFGLVAWWAYLHAGKSIKYTIIMAIAGVTAVLTTPRVAIVVFPLFTYALVQLLKSRNWLRAGLITLLPAFVYYVWIVFAFGSINGFIEHFAGAETQNTDSANNIFNYLGGNLYVPFHQWPLIIIGVLTAAWLIVKRMNLPTLFLITLPIITFYIVVADTGAYSALIMPFWYLLIGLGIRMTLDVEMPKIATRSFYSALVLVAICNIGIFTIKTFTIMGSLAMRDPEPLQEWVVQHLPSHSKIVGDDRFYYACIKNDCDYQYIDRVKDHDTRARFHACTYKPDFLFISTQTSPAVIDAYTKEFHFLETINYLPSNENSFITNIIRRLPIAIQSSYEGALIRVKPRECFAIDEKDESKSLAE